MKRILLVGSLVVLVATACTPTQLEDLTIVEQDDGVPTLTATVSDPDSVTIYRNVDGFANINVMCVGGNAFVTRSSAWADQQPMYLAVGTHNFCDG